MFNKMLVAFCMWLALLCETIAMPASASRPNVLLIVADDLGSGDLGSFYPQSGMVTPAIDGLAAAGMRFTRFYTESTCSASRAALLTGQYPARLGFHPVARGISKDVTTLADVFSLAGYQTLHIGKWHVGETSTHAAPAQAGFHTSLGFMNQWFLQGPGSGGELVMRTPVYENPWLQDTNGSWHHYQGYLPDILTQEAVKQIHAAPAAGMPWLMLYATPLPHAPLHVPPGSGLPETASDTDKYAAMVRHLDQNVAALLAAVEASGQRDQTLVIFLSDNGAPGKRDRSNAYFAGGKGGYGEGGIRTPMIWLDPAETQPGSLDERAVSIMDILPTLAARIGQPVPTPVDGVDLHGPAGFMQARSRPLFWLSGNAFSVLSTDKQSRYAQEWLLGKDQGSNLYRYGETIESRTGWQRWLAYPRTRQLQQSFDHWWQAVMQTPVSVSGGKDAYVLSGADFLRTPLKVWDFYLPVSIPVGTQGEVPLASQPGVWSASYLAEKNQLLIHAHGGHWAWSVSLADKCAVIGINMDLYDRFTNVSEGINPSHIRVTVNGKEIAREAWQIETLAEVDVTVPTQVGVGSDSVASKVRIGQPALFHTGYGVADSFFGLNEKKLHAGLCMQLD